MEPDSNLLIHQIRQRIFSRIVLKRVVEELRKDVPQLIENLNKSFSFIKYSTKISEKLSIKGFNEITFNDYIKLLNWQDLVRRILKIQEGKMSSFDNDENEGNMLKIIEQIEKTKKDNSFFEKFEVEEVFQLIIK